MRRKFRDQDLTSQIMAKSKYLLRIGRDPYNPNDKMGKRPKHYKTLHYRRKLMQSIINDIEKKLCILEEQIKQKDYEIDAQKVKLQLLKVSEAFSGKAKESMNYGSKAFSKLRGK